MSERKSPDNTDALMDQMLRQSLRAESPKLSSGFDKGLERRIHPLSSKARITLGVYSAVAVISSVWLLSDLPIPVLAAVAIITLISPTMLFIRHQRASKPQ